MTKKLQLGFTTFEVLVSVALFVLIIILTGTLFDILNKSYRKGTNEGEITQNARVSIDRMSREIRQAVDIITAMPLTDDEAGNPPVNEIFFQDGHDISQITYVYYYLDGSNFIRQQRAYYFASEPANYIPVGSSDEFGQPPEELIIEDRMVGEHFNTLEIWGGDGLINLRINLIKNNEELNIETSVYSRNL